MTRRLAPLALALLGLGCGNTPESVPTPPATTLARTAEHAHPTTSSPAVASASLPSLVGSASPNVEARRGLFEADDAYRARYPWLAAGVKVRTLLDTLDPPAGFTRVKVGEGSFGAFLRELPLRGADAPVKSFAGEVLHDAGDPRIAAVSELDVSPVDLQQCADSVIRLHAEWRWARRDVESVGYHFLSGDFATWRRYRAGERPKVDGNKVAWTSGASTKDDHAAYRKYLDMVFNYASTISLAGKTGVPIARDDVRAGDFFVLPGGPGHAILVLDLARDASGKTVALLGQGFMPAQDFQVLADGGNAWFSFDGEAVDTPFWPAPFPWSSLRRMKGDD